MNCVDIQRIVRDISLVKFCDTVRNGALRIATPFHYSDGSNIDIFITENGGLIQEIRLSDFGQTTAYLLDQSVKHWTSKKRKQVVADICKSLSIELVGGELRVSATPEEIPDAIVRLSQACIRIADMVMLQKFRPVQEFQEGFEEFIASYDIPYEPDAVIVGKFDRNVVVDFKVHGRRTESLVQTLSPSNQAAAHTVNNEIFRKWFDLENHRNNFSFLTVYNTEIDVFRKDDLRRLENVSTLIGFPAQQEEIQAILAA